MPLAAKALLDAAGARVTPTTLKYRGTSVTVGNLVATITVRVIAGRAGVVCAATEAARADATANASALVVKRMVTSLVQGGSRRTLGADRASWNGNSTRLPRSLPRSGVRIHLLSVSQNQILKKSGAAKPAQCRHGPWPLSGHPPPWDIEREAPDLRPLLAKCDPAAASL